MKNHLSIFNLLKPCMLLSHFIRNKFDEKPKEIPDHDKVEPNEEPQCPPTICYQRAEGKGQLFPLNEQGWRPKHDLQRCDVFMLE